MHDAPPAMAIALIVLAVGSVLAGYVGVPHALGGHNQLATWLAPAFSAPGAPGGESAAAEGLPAEEAAAEAHAEEALELTLMGVSSAIAFVGVFAGWFVWLKRRDIAAGMARSFPGLHRLLLNKYYVDELYDATVVHPLHGFSQVGLWRGFDVKVIDGLVNGVGATVNAGAALLRQWQTGSVRTYAGSLLGGVILVLGYFLWR